MLDIKFIKENQDLVRQAIKNRALKIDIDSGIGKYSYILPAGKA